MMYIKSTVIVSPNDNKYLAISTCINKYISIILPITKKKKECIYIYIYINARLKLNLKKKNSKANQKC